jgi:hypothetical protein
MSWHKFQEEEEREKRKGNEEKIRPSIGTTKHDDDSNIIKKILTRRIQRLQENVTNCG